MALVVRGGRVEPYTLLWGRSTVFFAAVLSLFIGSPLWSQTIVINEVIANNSTQTPIDFECGTPDMIELLNLTDQTIVLGGEVASDSYHLTDSDTFDAQTAWRFPPGAAIPAGGYLTIFCDGTGDSSCGEFHTRFGISSSGSEAVTLWGPEIGGRPPIVDQVVLPPLQADVSFGRVPDGAGPAPVPLALTFEVFDFFPPGESTFGTCTFSQDGAGCIFFCDGGFATGFRDCVGAPNGEPGNINPRLRRANLADVDNSPDADEPVTFMVEVEDDREPNNANIPVVEIVLRVDGADQTPIAMDFIGPTPVDPSRPLQRRGQWQATIPGFPAGTRVEFYFSAQDVDGGGATSPRQLCAEGQGPCNRIGEPGPGCERDPEDMDRFLECDTWYTYQAGYQRRPELDGLLINEVVASQDSLLLDQTDDGICGPADPTCRFDDFIELVNTSDAEIELSGLWLSNGRYSPKDWQFPPGSTIAAGQYLIVWTDGDGGRCPRPGEGRCPPPDDAQQCDAQDCPDPTNVALDEYHTDFNLALEGDQVYIHDTEENGFGVVHSVEFGFQFTDSSIALTPDGCRDGTFERRFGLEEVTPGGPNPRAGNDDCIVADRPFIRGDANSDCRFDVGDAVFILNTLFAGIGEATCRDAHDSNDDARNDVTDAVFILRRLFQGGLPIPPPGSLVQGMDPTADTLGPCEGQMNCP